MESERKGQDAPLVDVQVEPLQAEPDPNPDVKDPIGKGTAYTKTLDVPDEAGPAGDTKPDKP